MTSAFSWQNSISLCPASFRIPRKATCYQKHSIISSFENLQRFVKSVKISILGVVVSKGSAALLQLVCVCWGGGVACRERDWTGDVPSQTTVFSPSSNHLPHGLSLCVMCELSRLQVPFSQGECKFYTDFYLLFNLISIPLSTQVPAGPQVHRAWPYDRKRTNINAKMS